MAEETKGAGVKDVGTNIDELEISGDIPYRKLPAAAPDYDFATEQKMMRKLVGFLSVDTAELYRMLGLQEPLRGIPLRDGRLLTFPPATENSVSRTEDKSYVNRAKEVEKGVGARKIGMQKFGTQKFDFVPSTEIAREIAREILRATVPRRFHLISRELRDKFEFLADVLSIDVAVLHKMVPRLQETAILGTLEMYCRTAVSLSTREDDERIWESFLAIWRRFYSRQVAELGDEGLSLLHERSLHRLQALAGKKKGPLTVEEVNAVLTEIGTPKEDIELTLGRGV